MIQIINKVEIDHNLPDIINSETGKTVLLLGSGGTLWDDFDKAFFAFPSADIFCVNYSIFGINHYLVIHHNKYVKHWASLHPDIMAGGTKSREAFNTITHAQKPYDGIDYVWNIVGDGLSGMFATKIAMLLGYSKIILCGIPLDTKARFYGYPKTTWEHDDKSVRKAWINQVDNFRNTVFGMSGYTKELLGLPDELKSMEGVLA